MFNDLTISPYPGLRSFSEEESLFFKGRDSHVEEIIRLLQANKFLMVTGASGDGKSSAIFAGLVPNARAGFFKAKYNRWEVAHFRPERTPVKNFAHELDSILKSPAATLETELNRGFGSLTDLYMSSSLYYDSSGSEWKNAGKEEKQVMERSAANLLVIVDQFEEFFTNPENFRNGAPTEDAQVLVNLLLETAKISLRDDIPIYVVFTMRSDYIGQCAAFRGLPEFIGFSQFFVPRLKRKELKQIIGEPAKLNGNAIATRLVERILFDLSEGIDQLPILQHVLSQVWLMADKGKEEMDLLHYAKVGGMAAEDLPGNDRKAFDAWFDTLPEWKQEHFQKPGLNRILDIHADDLYEGAWDYYRQQDKEVAISRHESKLIIAMTLACLTKIDDSRAVRNRMTLQEITDIINQPKLTSDIVGAVINSYREQGNTFIRPFIEENNPDSSNLTPDTVLDITHESLIRNWQRLSKWTAKEFEFYETFLDFEKQLDKWLKSSRDSGYLLPIGPLTFFENWEKECHPNKFWINRYQSNTESVEENLKGSEVILNNSREFLKKSAGKVIVSKTFIKYGSLRIATVFAVMIVFVLSGFYYYDAERKQNKQVLKRITSQAQPLLTSLEVDNQTKGFYMLNLERVFKGAMMEELNRISNPEKQLNIALSTYTVTFQLDRTFDAQEKYDLVTFIDKTLDKSALSNERTLYYTNSFIDNLGYDYYLNNKVQVGAILQKQTDKLPGLIDNIINDGKIERVLTLNQGIENFLNWNNQPQEGIDHFLKILSPFDDKSKTTFNTFYPAEAGILNGRVGNISHNGGYQVAAALFAGKGALTKVEQATDSLLKYNKNYFDVMTFNNGTNIIGYLVQFGYLKEAEQYVRSLSGKTGISKRQLMNYTLDHAGYLKYIYQYIRIGEEGNYNPGLSILYSNNTGLLFDLYEKIIREEENGDRENFYLSLLYKQRGSYLSWQQHLPSNNIEQSVIYAWYDKALNTYSQVSDKFKNNSEQIYYRYWHDGIRLRTFQHKYFFLYPDYFYDEWHNDKYVSTAFMEYLVEKDLFDDIYTSTSDLEIINDWLANYNEHYPFENEVRNLTPFIPELLPKIFDLISNNSASNGFDKTFILLLVTNHAFASGQTEQAFAYYHELEIAKIGPLANRWQYLNYSFIYNQLVELAKNLAYNGHDNEAMALIESNQDYSYKTYIYGILANYLYSRHREAKAFAYLDSAFINKDRVVTSTLQFQLDPSFPIINTLSGIGSTALDQQARSMFVEMAPGTKGGGLFNYIMGIAWEGNYYRAVEAIPAQGSSVTELLHYSIILSEEANKLGPRPGWEKLAHRWNFITKEYIEFRDQNN